MLICLAYHKILAQTDDSIHTVSVDSFAKHLSIIKQSGVPLATSFFSVKEVSKRAGLLLTFDDGTIDHYTTVMPLLKQFKMPAIFYIPTAKLDTNGYITSRQAGGMVENGHVLGSHTHTHPRLPSKGTSQIIEEMEVSAQVLQDIHGVADAFCPTWRTI